MIPEKDNYYWIFTNGFYHKYSPVYYGNDGWKITQNDSVSFVSTHTLKKIYGNESIIRKVDFTKDQIEPCDKHSSVFDFIVLESENNKPMVFTGYANLNLFVYYGKLTRLNTSDFKILKFS